MRKIVSLLLLLLSLQVVAQQPANMSIVRFYENPQDLTAREPEHERMDGNNDRFSIIKVKSVTPGDNLNAYRFNFGQMECQLRPMVELGELWVYVQRGAKHVTISRTGYTTINRYDLGVTIPAGAVYCLELSAATPKARKQWVRFNITPVEAKATISYKSDTPGSTLQILGTADENGSLAKMLEVGNYTYTVMSENCHPYEARLVLTGGEMSVQNITLRPRYAKVAMRVANDTEILIDGESKGKGPWSGVLNAGTYNVETRKDKHRTAAETIVVEEGREKSFTLKEPTPIVGSIALNSTPLDAVVSIDGTPHGKTPISIESLLVGTYSVTLTKSGYTTERFTIEVRDGEVAEHEVVLKKGSDHKVVLKNSSDHKVVLKNSSNHEAVLKNSGNHEAVDLGLSVKWATSNVGANAPHEYGGYYAWGETEEKSDYGWNSYKWNKRKKINLTKYCTNSSYGKVDNKKTLEPQDDVAHVNWGGSWRMPTYEELEELHKKCEWAWTTQNGVSGHKVTGPNGNSIFLPAAGYRYGTGDYLIGTYGYYWTSSLDSSESKNAYNLHIGNYGSRGLSRQSAGRQHGHTVRPVCK